MNALEVEIRHAQDRLNAQLSSISGIKQQVYVNLIYYVIIVCSMIFCACIILADLYRILQAHHQNTKRVEAAENNYKRLFVNGENHGDNYVYPVSDNLNINMSKEILKNLKQTDANIIDNMEYLKKFREKHNMNHTLFVRTDPKSLVNDDNYVYEPGNNDFWSMIFERPTYHSILNSDPRNYIEF